MITILYSIFAIAMLAATIAGLTYIISRIRRFSWMKKIIAKNRILGWIISLLPIIITAIFCYINIVNTIIVVVHVIIFWLLCDLLGCIIKKARKKEFHFYWQGLLAIIISVSYLGSGWYFAHHVYETDYTLRTDKPLGQDTFRIAQISDSHLGATFQADGFIRHLKTIQKTNPDLIVITGDYVDDDTKKKEMVKATKGLGQMKAKYGIYYIFGNHDRGYMNYRDFDTDDLVNELKNNNIKILDDKAVKINDEITLVGRLDKETFKRKSAKSIMKDVDTSKYVIMLDHEPNDFDNEADTHPDLVLSGHTHGGQMIPVGWLGEISGANDKTYGREKRKDTTFIVNSGISDWAIKFKTGTIAEFGIIDIKAKK